MQQKIPCYESAMSTVLARISTMFYLFGGVYLSVFLAAHHWTLFNKYNIPLIFFNTTNCNKRFKLSNVEHRAVIVDNNLIRKWPIDAANASNFRAI